MHVKATLTDLWCLQRSFAARWKPQLIGARCVQSLCRFFVTRSSDEAEEDAATNSTQDDPAKGNMTKSVYRVAPNATCLSCAYEDRLNRWRTDCTIQWRRKRLCERPSKTAHIARTVCALLYQQSIGASIAVASSYRGGGKSEGIDVPIEKDSISFDDVAIIPVEPGGWCFFDCMARHVGAHRTATDVCVARESLAALAMEQLAFGRDRFANDLEVDPRVRAEILTRHGNPIVRELLQRVMVHCDDFDCYVMDKVLEYTRAPNVLDTRFYADDLEIRALLLNLELSLLRIWPTRRQMNDTGCFTGRDGSYTVVESIGDARGLVELSQVDVAVLHHQDPGYQHYDCVSFQGGTLHMSTEACARLLSAFEASTLVSSVLRNDVVAATRAVFTLLGIGLPQGDEELLCPLDLLLEHFPVEEHCRLRRLLRSGSPWYRCQREGCLKPSLSGAKGEFCNETCRAAVLVTHAGNALSRIEFNFGELSDVASDDREAEAELDAMAVDASEDLGYTLAASSSTHGSSNEGGAKINDPTTLEDILPGCYNSAMEPTDDVGTGVMAGVEVSKENMSVAEWHALMKSMGSGLCDPAEESESDAEAGGLSDDEEEADVDEMFQVRSLPVHMRTWQTDEDLESDRIKLLSEALREQPHLPPDPDDPDAIAHFSDLGSIDNYVRLPYAHCPFKRCRWMQLHGQDTSGNVHAPEYYLLRHLRLEHKQDFTTCCGKECVQEDEYLDYLEEAMKVKAREAREMPIIGGSVDRRTLEHLYNAYNDDTIHCYM